MTKETLKHHCKKWSVKELCFQLVADGIRFGRQIIPQKKLDETERILAAELRRRINHKKYENL
jgi:hypothetical protein